MTNPVKEMKSVEESTREFVKSMSAILNVEEIARATGKKLKELAVEVDRLRDAPSTSQSKIDELEAKLKELEQDKERLDWLIENSLEDSSYELNTVALVSGKGVVMHDTRQAIDNARKAE